MTKTQLLKQFKKFTKFEKASGLSLNASKSSIWTKNINYSKNSILNVPISTQNFTYLGYKISQNGAIFDHTKKLETLSNSLIFYKKFKLSLLQKTVVINSFVLPKSFYSLYASPTPPKDFFTKFNNILRWFLKSDISPFDPRKTYRNKMSLERFYQPILKGGIGLFSISARYLAMKLQLFIKALQDQTHLYNKELIDSLKRMEDRYSFSPIFYVKQDSHSLPYLLKDLLPFLRYAQLSTSPNQITKATTTNLLKATLYSNGIKLDTSLRTCYQVVKNALYKTELTSTQLDWKTRFSIDYSQSNHF